MRHGAGALLALAERLLHLADLGPLEVAHLEGHLLQRGCDQRKRAYIVGVAIALQHLCGYIGGIDTELVADIVLDERRDIGEIADGAAHLAGLDACGRSLEALDVALHLLKPKGPLEAETGNVGMDAVRAADARGGLELHGAASQHLEELLEVFQQDGISLLDEVAVGRIHHVRRSQTVMDPFALLTETLAGGAGERHDIVAGLLLDLLDAVDLESGLGPDLLHILSGDDTELAPSLAGEDFDFEIGAELVFLGPDVPHDLP